MEASVPVGECDYCLEAEATSYLPMLFLQQMQEESPILLLAGGTSNFWPNKPLYSAMPYLMAANVITGVGTLQMRGVKPSYIFSNDRTACSQIRHISADRA